METKQAIAYFEKFSPTSEEYLTFKKILLDLKAATENCVQQKIVNAARLDTTFSFRVVDSQDKTKFLADYGSLKNLRVIQEIADKLMLQNPCKISLNFWVDFGGTNNKRKFNNTTGTQTKRPKTESASNGETDNSSDSSDSSRKISHLLSRQS